VTGSYTCTSPSRAAMIDAAQDNGHGNVAIGSRAVTMTCDGVNHAFSSNIPGNAGAGNMAFGDTGNEVEVVAWSIIPVVTGPPPPASTTTSTFS